jgi:dTDP-4-amino-4,6-dideoxygalactose transaminase
MRINALGNMAEVIPFVGLDRQHDPIRAELQEAFERVVGTSAFILGEEVERFEDEFARYCGSEHSVGVASGTAALVLAFRAAGIGPGDEVIVPAHTFIASALGVIHAGATPVLCDVDAGTGLIDAASAESVVCERSAAILAVHLYGQTCDMDAIRAVADRHDLLVVEDAAQAHGASWNGTRAGSLGDVACFSFYPSKNLGALGDGGAICTGDHDIAQRARALRHLGQLQKGAHDLTGYNERLDGLHAALLRAKLPHLDDWNAARRERAADYRELLGERVGLLEEQDGAECVYHLFPIRVDDRDQLRAVLNDSGVQTGIHYSPALTEQPPTAESATGEYPSAAAWAAEELSLPLFEHLTRAEVERVAEACLAAVPVGSRS